jgi:hypothetical protein
MNDLTWSPFDSHKKAYQGFMEWKQYMLEMRNSVQSRLESVKQKDEPYFLGKLSRRQTPFALFQMY